MIIYAYTAKSPEGKSLSGELTVASKKEAMMELRSRGLQPISMTESKAGKTKKTISREHTVSGKDVILFTEELSELLKAGLPIEPALASMANRDDVGAVKTISEKLRAYITDGMPLSVALPKVSNKFDALYCNLVAAGEASGSLSSIVTQHGVYLKDRAALRSKLIFAMLYPALLLLACFGVMLVFLFYLLPQIATMLSSVDDEGMPLGVKLSLALGDFLKANWIYLIALLIVLGIAIKIYFDDEANRAKWDKTSLELPFYGKVVKYGFYVQWLQTLSNLLSNGVPLVKALELTNETVFNRFYKAELTKVTDRVKDGLKLTSSMKQADVFPSAMVDLIAVGDQTGKMDEAVSRAAKYFDAKLEVVLKVFMAMITPVILLGLALLVGVLCSTMMQAIYGAIQNMK